MAEGRHYAPVTLAEAIKTNGGEQQLLSTLFNYAKDGSIDRAARGGFAPEVHEWYARMSSGKTVEDITKAANSESQARLSSEIAAGRIDAKTGALIPTAAEAKAEEEYKQRAAAMAGGPPAPTATVNPTNPEQRYNIEEIGTGRKGYQSEGAPIPPGWQAIGGSPVAQPGAPAALAGTTPPASGATARAGASDTTGQPQIPTTPGTSPANIPTTALQPGARGDAVKQLQDFLVAAGFMTAEQVATGPGIYGPQTTAAVRALQESLGVDNSSGPGYFGPKTIAAVQAALAGSGGQQGGQNGQAPGVEAETVPGGTVGTTPGNNLSGILSGLGIQTNPSTSLNDIVTQLSKLYGLDEVNGEMKKLDDEYAENVANVNDDPWISEGLRVTRIRKLEEKYDTKRSQLMSRLALQNDVIGQAIQLYNTERNFQQENAQIAMREQQRLLDNQMAERRFQQDERKLLQDQQRVDTTVVERSDGSKVLINAQTGTVISTISGPSAVVGVGPGGSPTPGYNVYGKPLTAEQAKASGYAQRIASANQTFDALGGQFSGVGAMIGQFSPNILQSPERQQFEQAKRNFVNAVLRRESGAAISESEFNSANKQYFPQPGDSNKVLEQKRQNREQTYQNILVESGQSVPNTSKPVAPGTPTVSDFNYVMSLKLK